jgi:hypothetical protein
MKKLVLFSVVFAMASFATLAQGVITFKESNKVFGKIKEGEKAVHTFTFTNTGDQPLIVSAANPSCGCTTPSFTKDPVAPGKTGFITTSFDSNGRPGQFNKSVSVVSNASNPNVTLTFSGEVIPATPAAVASEVTPVPAAAPAAPAKAIKPAPVTKAKKVIKKAA